MAVTAWTWLTNDACVYGSPMLLYRLIVTGGAADCTVEVYNGRDTSAGKLMTVKAAAGRTRVVSLNPALFLANGLYVDLDANTTGVGVQWEPTPEPGPG